MKYKVKEKKVNKTLDKDKSLFLDLRELQSTLTENEFNEFLHILKADAEKAGITVDEHLFDEENKE